MSECDCTVQCTHTTHDTRQNHVDGHCSRIPNNDIEPFNYIIEHLQCCNTVANMIEYKIQHIATKARNHQIRCVKAAPKLLACHARMQLHTQEIFANFRTNQMQIEFGLCLFGEKILFGSKKHILDFLFTWKLNSGRRRQV